MAQSGIYETQLVNISLQFRVQLVFSARRAARTSGSSPECPFGIVSMEKDRSQWHAISRSHCAVTRFIITAVLTDIAAAVMPIPLTFI